MAASCMCKNGDPGKLSGAPIEPRHTEQSVFHYGGRDIWNASADVNQLVFLFQPFSLVIIGQGYIFFYFKWLIWSLLSFKSWHFKIHTWNQLNFFKSWFTETWYITLNMTAGMWNLKKIHILLWFISYKGLWNGAKRKH